MKVKTTTALLLIALLLTGCTGAGQTPATQAATSAPAETAAAVPTVPETAAPETTVPETTLPETAAPESAAPAVPAEPAADFVPQVIPVITSTQKQVTVTTADEFLQAIAPDTEIIVDAEQIDLTTASDYKTGSTAYYRWQETFDGYELYIQGVTNLTIRGATDDRTAATLAVQPRYANVLNFENCSNIMVRDLTAGHLPEPGYCVGGVLRFVNSQDALVENCGLFGCGTWGVIGESSKTIQIVSNDIYECSYGGVTLTNCKDVNVDGNTFRDLGDELGPGYELSTYICQNITMNGEDQISYN